MSNKIDTIKCAFEKPCIARVYGYCCAEETSDVKNECEQEMCTGCKYDTKKYCKTFLGIRSHCIDNNYIDKIIK